MDWTELKCVRTQQPYWKLSQLLGGYEAHPWAKGSATEFVHQIFQLQPFTHSLVSDKQHWGGLGGGVCVCFFLLSFFFRFSVLSQSDGNMFPTSAVGGLSNPELPDTHNITKADVSASPQLQQVGGMGRRGGEPRRFVV